MDKKTHGSLFSGIGGFDLAAEWAGFRNIFQVEKDKFCNKVLEKNFPKAKRYHDINDFSGKKYRGTIDVPQVAYQIFKAIKETEEALIKQLFHN